ncbi:uncharacterized protein K452DRAFT_224155 [Aplosporella prunicola CBS 121167]|uniref:Uncharacterized protein n=1 Tax=Aplosporella prunicola CBS 121167 TaxID=1176127 RepID=A0A6A6BJN0_9PEZI|nr:uncharacterized protein K452DRAFT_224155 [Aplosporella prunicola CBS 121167]KAF2143535.1 hypothetical protein K452DRAFT_224155 [Aplosporella prunicola CBS 121167]
MDSPGQTTVCDEPQRKDGKRRDSGLDPFITQMDDASYAYYSLIQQYALRSFQGRDFQYKAFAAAVSSQGRTDEQRCRVTVIEFIGSSSEEVALHNGEHLQQYLDSGEMMRDGRARRIFVVEDLAVRHICLLGPRLQIHPSVFANHYNHDSASAHANCMRAIPLSDKLNTEDGMKNPSAVRPTGEKRRFALRYPTTMPRLSAQHNPDPKLCPDWLKPTPEISNQNAYAKFNIERGIDTPDINDLWDEPGKVAIMDNQVTYWSRPENDGWAGMF